MIRIVLEIVFFILFVTGGAFIYLGINSLKKALKNAQKNNDALYDKAIRYIKLFILIEVINGIFFVICLVLLN